MLNMVGLASSEESEELSPSFPSGKANPQRFRLSGKSYVILLLSFSLRNGDYAYICLPSDRNGSMYRIMSLFSLLISAIALLMPSSDISLSFLFRGALKEEQKPKATPSSMNSGMLFKFESQR
jgi:hypothetical protein